MSTYGMLPLDNVTVKITMLLRPKTFLFPVPAREGTINVLVLEISPYVFLLDDEGVSTFFEREHLNNLIAKSPT
jgi:hypothetical protein